MITVRFDDIDGDLSLTVRGHAGLSTQGLDIVCAAASILAYTVAQSVTDMNTSGCLTKAPTTKLSKGDALIMCHPVDASISMVRQIYLVAQTGYQLLAHYYPQYVRLTRFGKAKA